MKNSNKISPYGKYSLGIGSILSNSNRLFAGLDNPEIIESYKVSTRRDLKRACISKNMIKNYETLDVGTGWQAIALHLLGAKKVQHYDLSPENVNRLKSFIEKNSLQDRITTKHVDLVRYRLPKDNFDFVYLHGIVQHFSNVSIGLMNCLESIKMGGILWLYFYRSGSFVQFVIFLIQDLIDKNKNIKEYFLNSILLYSDNCRPNYFISGLIDDFFSLHQYLYTPESYISFLSKCGFKVISSSKLGSQQKKVDHNSFHESVILICKKVSQATQRQKTDALKILLPSKSINQLDPRNYSAADKEILQTINDYFKLKKLLFSKQAPVSLIMCLAFRIYLFLQNAKKDIGSKNLHPRLRVILNNTKEAIEKEF